MNLMKEQPTQSSSSSGAYFWFFFHFLFYDDLKKKKGGGNNRLIFQIIIFEKYVEIKINRKKNDPQISIKLCIVVQKQLSPGFLKV